MTEFRESVTSDTFPLNSQKSKSKCVYFNLKVQVYKLVKLVFYLRFTELQSSVWRNLFIIHALVHLTPRQHHILCLAASASSENVQIHCETVTDLPVFIPALVPGASVMDQPVLYYTNIKELVALIFWYSFKVWNSMSPTNHIYIMWFVQKLVMR